MQERLGEPARQALGQLRQSERVPCISYYVIERGPGVSDHAVVKPVPIEGAGGTRTLHQEGVEFLGGTQLDDGGPHRLSDDIVVIAPGLVIVMSPGCQTKRLAILAFSASVSTFGPAAS